MKMYLKILVISVLASITFAHAQTPEADYVKANYTKIEKLIPMRDGVQLFTAIYIPKSSPTKYPFLITRTPYTVQPYGDDKFKASLGGYLEMAKEGFIFVYQDVRGRWMSEGTFADVRPHNPNKKTANDIDESSDTYDTIDWLIKNIPNNNGKAGIFGISYPGFYATAALPGAHPGLKAVSPQAPVTDWFMGDDFHHNGAFFLMDAFAFQFGFGAPRPKPITPDKGPKPFVFPIKDNYKFYLDLGALKNVNKRYYGDSIKFWNEMMAHGNYDAYWKARNVRTHLKRITPAVMVVGGFYDAEDTFGALATYKAIEAQDPAANNKLVMGPWYHGGWVRSKGDFLGDIKFGQETSTYYQRQLELPFFKYHLKGEGTFNAAEATIFLTGSNEWKNFATWPPKQSVGKTLYFHPNGKLSFEKPTGATGFDEYVSDPAKPVPYQEGIHQRRTREYMIDDQRFAARRPDVMVYQTDVLREDVTLTGPLLARLMVSTSGTDADYVVKLIDVYPEDEPDPIPNPENIMMAGYQMLVRGEVMRGKFRNSFETPVPFIPNKVTPVNYTLPDVAHTFKKGHRIMIQLQNSWFPLVDRNPQKFMDIYKAADKDFNKATHRIYFSSTQASGIGVNILNP